MKHILLTLVLAVAFYIPSEAQELQQDAESKRWHYTHVFEAPKISASELYKRIINNYVPQADIIQSTIENEKVVLRYQFRLGTFKYGMLTETFDIKEGRLRWRVSNIVYLKAVTSLSKYKSLDETSDKAIIKKVNKLIPDGIKDVKDKVINVSLEKDDW